MSLWRLLVQAIENGDAHAAIAERFGVRASDVDDLSRWERQEREAIAKWLLRE